MTSRPYAKHTRDPGRNLDILQLSAAKKEVCCFVGIKGAFGEMVMTERSVVSAQGGDLFKSTIISVCIAGARKTRQGGR